VKVVVGLGNPGRDYENTPHNVGFAVLDETGVRWGCEWRRSLRFRSQFARAGSGEKTVYLVKPQTYMNLSGSAVVPMLRYHGAAPADLVVVLDDADMPVGRIRVRERGGSGGHRGLASVLEGVGTEEVVRVRVGIGRRENDGGLVEHVLTPFSDAERERMGRAIRVAADAVEMIVRSGPASAMNAFNRWRADAEPGERDGTSMQRGE
jgi:PTH1 family peptidyl-tRNA hydrolase